MMDSHSPSSDVARRPAPVPEAAARCASVAGLRGLSRHRAAASAAAAGRHSADAVGAHRDLCYRTDDRGRWTTTSRGSTPASRSASASSSQDGCSTTTGGRCRRRWSRCGRRTRPAAIRTAGRHPCAPLDPNFSGAGPHRDRRRGPVPVRDHQARRVSVAQPSQRLAAGAHPFLAVRAELPHAARHADVLSRRPAARASTRSSTRSRLRARASGSSRLRRGRHAAGMGARLPIRHRPARPRRDADGGLACRG